MIKEKYLWCILIIAMPLGVLFIKIGFDLGIGVYLFHGSKWGGFSLIVGLLIFIWGTLVPIFELYDRYSKN